MASPLKLPIRVVVYGRGCGEEEVRRRLSVQILPTSTLEVVEGNLTWQPAPCVQRP